MKFNFLLSLCFLTCIANIPLIVSAEQSQQKPTLEDVKKFIKDSEEKLKEYSEYAGHVAWIQATFITDDTNWLMTKVSAEGTKLSVRLANEAKKYQNMKLPQNLRRKINILKSAITLPAPEKDLKEADELAEISTFLDSTYSTGKFTYKGNVLNLNDMSEIMASSKNPEELKDIWKGWRTISPPMKPKFARLVEISNEGARELGFKDTGDMWRSNYDMKPDQFAAELDRLWEQVQPLYKDLHCYVRAKLNEAYGDKVQPLDKPIRADLLGNMWAQSWEKIYPLLVPENANPAYDLTELLKENNYSVKEMFKTGESFFSSLGFAPLPETFWKRSLFVRPRDREVVCHASAWDVDNYDDIRIKMCTLVNEEDFKTIHHELGHNYYQRAYKHQDTLYQNGANDGFHEAIGDMLALSITPDYLLKLGLIKQVPSEDKDIGLLLHRALEKVAFLPFGLLIDKWRWQVFSGQVTPNEYNKSWWELRRYYQGIEPPVKRTSQDFDPGAKYHVAGSVPYARYFLAHILQFQFYKESCKLAGWKGPLHRCSFYKSKEAGKALNNMLEKGASQPWQDTLEEFVGSREMDAGVLVEYFAPLHKWLKQQNKGKQCGW